MSKGLLIYIFLISGFGFILLLILSILAFLDVESLEIEENRNKNSGIMLLVNSIVYLIIAIISFCIIRRDSNKALFIKESS